MGVATLILLLCKCNAHGQLLYLNTDYNLYIKYNLHCYSLNQTLQPVPLMSEITLLPSSELLPHHNYSKLNRLFDISSVGK